MVDITRHSVCVLYVLCMEFELTVCLNKYSPLKHSSDMWACTEFNVVSMVLNNR